MEPSEHEKTMIRTALNNHGVVTTGMIANETKLSTTHASKCLKDSNYFSEHSRGVYIYVGPVLKIEPTEQVDFNELNEILKNDYPFKITEQNAMLVEEFDGKTVRIVKIPVFDDKMRNSIIEILKARPHFKNAVFKSSDTDIQNIRKHRRG